MDADDGPGRGCPNDATVRAAGKVSEAFGDDWAHRRRTRIVIRTNGGV